MPPLRAKIEKLDDVADSLEELWISYNQVTTLDGLSNLSHLTRLYMSNNSVKSWSELDKLVSGATLLQVTLRTSARGEAPAEQNYTEDHFALTGYFDVF